MKNLKLIITAFIFFALSFANVHAATASFSVSGGGNVNVGQSISVTISVNGSASYNAVSASVSYTNLTYVSSSVSSNWTPVSGPSNSGSTVNFSGAVLGNSYTGTKTVMTINFKASNLGTATIKPSGTIALADGSGTQVAGSGNTATYNVTTAPTATPTPKPLPGAVTITSITHSSTSVWYKAKDVIINWTKPDGITEFSYILDQSANTTPDDTNEGGEVTKTFTNVSQGTSYFHIKGKNDVGWGAVSHFQVNIDYTNPDPFTITKTESGTQYILYFSTNDNGSGIAKYNVRVDGVDKGEQRSGHIIDKTVSQVEVEALDKAGNATISKLDIKNSATVTNTTIIPSNTSNNSLLEGSLGKVGIIFVGASTFLLVYGATISFLYWKKFWHH